MPPLPTTYPQDSPGEKNLEPPLFRKRSGFQSVLLATSYLGEIPKHPPTVRGHVGLTSGGSGTIECDQQTGREAPRHERTDMTVKKNTAPAARAGRWSVRTTIREGR